MVHHAFLTSWTALAPDPSPALSPGSSYRFLYNHVCPVPAPSQASPFLDSPTPAPSHASSSPSSPASPSSASYPASSTGSRPGSDLEHDKEDFTLLIQELGAVLHRCPPTTSVHLVPSQPGQAADRGHERRPRQGRGRLRRAGHLTGLGRSEIKYLSSVRSAEHHGLRLSRRLGEFYWWVGRRSKYDVIA